MNGADALCETLLANGVDVCFANPGTSEMHFVAALDGQPKMRCVLGLFEGVVTGAADGYARMADRPAATLLHLGPGLANGLANLHNARRAETPMLNIVGDHATYHGKFDPPLASDIESFARPVSKWLGRAAFPRDIAPLTAAAYRHAVEERGVATLILPADVAWGRVRPDEMLQATAARSAATVPAERIDAIAGSMLAAKRPVLLLGGTALRREALGEAAKLSARTGIPLIAPASNSRMERGAGLPAVRRIPYDIMQARNFLRDFDLIVLVGARLPVAAFAYPDLPSQLVSDDSQILTLTASAEDHAAALAALVDAFPVKGEAAKENQPSIRQEVPVEGALTAETISAIVAQRLPEGAVVCDESVTSGRHFFNLSCSAAPHDYLQLTGQAIGIGIPLAVGAAIAAPGRKVIGLQADGSGMYTAQGLWTQARERLDVITIVFANRRYAVLQNEMKKMGIGDFGRNAESMLSLGNPEISWIRLAESMGVGGRRVASLHEFSAAFDAALRGTGPFLIEALID